MDDYEQTLRDLQDIMRQMEQAEHLPSIERVRLMNRLFVEFLHQRGRLTPEQRKDFAHLLPKEH